MNQILITGAVASANPESIDLYSKLVDVCNGYAIKSYSPIDTMNFKGTNKERYIRALQLLITSELVIAEVSTPSTGQGIELQEASRNSIPIVLVAKEGSKVSGLVLGLPNIKSMIYYSDIDELTEKLRLELSIKEGE